MWVSGLNLINCEGSSSKYLLGFTNIVPSELQRAIDALLMFFGSGHYRVERPSCFTIIEEPEDPLELRLSESLKDQRPRMLICTDKKESPLVSVATCSH